MTTQHITTLQNLRDPKSLADDRTLAMILCQARLLALALPVIAPHTADPDQTHRAAQALHRMMRE